MTAGSILDAALVALPILVWSLHVAFLLPFLDASNGDAKFIAGMRFFVFGTAVMLPCGLAALFRLRMGFRWSRFAAVLLNLTWLYYLKVILFGPTLGNL